jgi:molybdopterin-containing oxidoreductase family iron-sulfur binding subunit
VFGDLQDPDSRVSKLHADQRSYDLVPSLYTKPRTRYMARVRNPNPQLEQPGAAAAEGAR